MVLLRCDNVQAEHLSGDQLIEHLNLVVIN